MGIHGLTSFIDNNPHLLKDHHLHDCRVVIDGNNFFHFLYFYCNVRFQYGGDYDTYHRKIAMIFSMFKSCNIEPYIVFDGAYTVDGKKLLTTISRARDRIYAAKRIINGQRGTLIPCLARTTFRQTLDSLGVQHATCDFEADNQLVTLANKWNCPIISNDSDFYIFDLNAGFIPLDYIDFRPKVYKPASVSRPEGGEHDSDSHTFEDDAGSYTFLACQFYHVDKFIGCFKSLNRSVLPLFATMLGNDYVEAAAFERFYNKKTPKNAARRYSASKKHSKIVSVLYWLEEKGNLEEVLPEVLTFIKKDRRQRVEKLLTDSIKGYVETEVFESFSLCEYFEGNRDAALQRTEIVRSCRGDKLPAWFLRGVRCGEIPVFLLNAVLLQRIILQTQVESVKLPASFSTSAALRHVMYGILFDDGSSQPEESTEGASDTTSADHQSSSAISQDKSPIVEEYTRHNMELRKVPVQPCRSLPKYGQLPVLETVPQLSSADKRALVTETLGSSEEFVRKFESSLQLFSMCLVFWVRNASPRVTVHHLQGLLLSVILLQVRKELHDRGDSKDIHDRGDSKDIHDRGDSKDIHDRGDSKDNHDRGDSKDIHDGGDQLLGLDGKDRTTQMCSVQNEGSAPKDSESKGERLQPTVHATNGNESGTVTHTAVNRTSSCLQKGVDGSGSDKLQHCYEEDVVDCDSQQHKSLSDDDSSPNAKDSMQLEETDQSVSAKQGELVSVSSVCHSASYKVLQKVRDNLRKYYHEPAKVSSKNPSDHPAYHAAAQLLACLLDSMYLNSLLMCPFSSPQPSLLFNGSFVYSIIQELQNRANPDLFLFEMLIKGSPLAALFDTWCSSIVSEIGEGFLVEQKVHGKKCCKSARRKKKRTLTDCGVEADGGDLGSDVGQSGEKVVATCDLSNRFGALWLGGFDDL